MRQQGAPIARPVVRVGRIATLYIGLAISWFTLMATLGPEGIIGTRILHAYGIGAVLCVLNLVGFGVLLLVTMALRRAGILRALQALGMRPWSGRAVAASLLAIGAAVVLLYTLGYREQNRSVMILLPFDVLGPLVEEAIFRGFLFLQLRRWAGLPFWSAAVLASVPFAMEHIYQGVTTAVLLEVLTVTFLGGIIFCWLVERWGNIWSSWTLHSGLNLLFSLFPLGANASENLVGNIERLTAIACAIAATWLMTRHRAADPETMAPPAVPDPTETTDYTRTRDQRT